MAVPLHPPTSLDSALRAPDRAARRLTRSARSASAERSARWQGTSYASAPFLQDAPPATIAVPRSWRGGSHAAGHRAGRNAGRATSATTRSSTAGSSTARVESLAAHRVATDDAVAAFLAVAEQHAAHRRRHGRRPSREAARVARPSLVELDREPAPASGATPTGASGGRRRIAAVAAVGVAALAVPAAISVASPDHGVDVDAASAEVTVPTDARTTATHADAGPFRPVRELAETPETTVPTTVPTTVAPTTVATAPPTTARPLTTTTWRPATTAPPTTRVTVTQQAPTYRGGDQFLACVRHRESRGNYTALNPSGASGAYQFLPGTAQATANYAGRSDLAATPVSNWSAADQDAMAQVLYQWQGAAPWGGAC